MLPIKETTVFIWLPEAMDPMQGALQDNDKVPQAVSQFWLAADQRNREEDMQPDRTFVTIGGLRVLACEGVSV